MCWFNVTAEKTRKAIYYQVTPNNGRVNFYAVEQFWVRFSNRHYRTKINNISTKHLAAIPNQCLESQIWNQQHISCVPFYYRTRTFQCMFHKQFNFLQFHLSFSVQNITRDLIFYSRMKPRHVGFLSEDSCTTGRQQFNAITAFF